MRCGGCNVVLSTSPHSACDLLHSSTDLVMPLVTRPPLLPLCARCSWCRGAPPCWSASPLHQTSPIQFSTYDTALTLQSVLPSSLVVTMLRSRLVQERVCGGWRWTPCSSGAPLTQHSAVAIQI